MARKNIIEMKTVIILFIIIISRAVFSNNNTELDSLNFNSTKLEKIISEKIKSKTKLLSNATWDLGPFQWGPDSTFISEIIWRSRLSSIIISNKSYIVEEFFIGLRLGGFYYLGIGNFIVKKYKLIYEEKFRKNRFGHLFSKIFKNKKLNFKIDHFSMSIEAGHEGMLRLGTPLFNGITDLTLLFFGNKEKRFSIVFDKKNKEYQKSIIIGNKYKKGMEFYSGFWITRFRHFKWNTSTGKNKIFASLQSAPKANYEINKLGFIKNKSEINKNLFESKYKFSVKKTIEKYGSNYKKLSFLKVINKTWINTNIYKENNEIKIKSERSNWFFPKLSERHQRLLRVDKNKYNNKKLFLKIFLKDSRVTKREKRKYYKKMLKDFPNLYKKVGNNLKLDITFHCKISKKTTMKNMSKLFKKKRHYYKLSSIKNIIKNLNENEYFLEINMISNKKRFYLTRGFYKPSIKLYSETELYINN